MRFCEVLWRINRFSGFLGLDGEPHSVPFRPLPQQRAVPKEPTRSQREGHVLCHCLTSIMRRGKTRRALCSRVLAEPQVKPRLPARRGRIVRLAYPCCGIYRRWLEVGSDRERTVHCQRRKTLFEELFVCAYVFLFVRSVVRLFVCLMCTSQEGSSLVLSTRRWRRCSVFQGHVSASVPFNDSFFSCDDPRFVQCDWMPVPWMNSPSPLRRT